MDSVQDRLPVPNVMQTPAALIPLNQMEVTVHTTRVQYPTSQTSKNGSFTSTDGEGQHKPKELVSDEEQQRVVES